MRRKTPGEPSAWTMPSKYTTVHEMNSLDVWKSKAWDEWRTAVTPVWSGEIRQGMVHAEGSPGVFRRIFPA